MTSFTLIYLTFAAVFGATTTAYLSSWPRRRATDAGPRALAFGIWFALLLLAYLLGRG